MYLASVPPGQIHFSTSKFLQTIKYFNQMSIHNKLDNFQFTILSLHLRMPPKMNYYDLFLLLMLWHLSILVLLLCHRQLQRTIVLSVEMTNLKIFFSIFEFSIYFNLLFESIVIDIYSQSNVKS